MADTFEHEPGKISIFKNKYREGNQPEYRGKGKVVLPDGHVMKIEVGLWVNTDKNGKQYFGGDIKEDTYVAPPPEPKPTPDVDPDFDDDIPF